MFEFVELGSISADPIVDAVLLIVLSVILAYVMLFVWHYWRSRTGDSYRGSPAENAAEELGDRIYGFTTGVVATLAIFAGTAAEIGAFAIGHIAEVPAVLIAAIGLGEVSGVYSLTPGVFVIAAIGAFLLSLAVARSRRR